jgi:hypothetical protein
MEEGNEIWHMECEQSVHVRVTTIIRELLKYKLDLVGVQEVRWDKGGTARAGNYIFFLYGKGNENNQLGTGFFVHQKIVPAIEKSRIC